MLFDPGGRMLPRTGPGAGVIEIESEELDDITIGKLKVKN
jgi:hypothetical protein